MRLSAPIAMAIAMLTVACASERAPYVKPWAEPSQFEQVDAHCETQPDYDSCMVEAGWHRSTGALARALRGLPFRDACDRIHADPGARCLCLRRPDDPGKDNLRLFVAFDTQEIAERLQDDHTEAFVSFCVFAEAAQEQDTADVVLHVAFGTPDHQIYHETCENIMEQLFQEESPPSVFQEESSPSE